MNNAAIDGPPIVPSATNRDGVFRRYREELEWMATFLTGDKRIGEACVVDACALADSENFAFQDWLVEWARLATIRSAAQIQRRRIAQLSSAYMRQPCAHGKHATLSHESIELVVEQSNLLLTKLDVLCRFALVICGLEKRVANEAALLLGVDPITVESAYCAATQVLEVIGCEQFQRKDASAAYCN